ncbi:COP9 signalosome complex subunit 4, partial [Ananas comosus]
MATTAAGTTTTTTTPSSPPASSPPSPPGPSSPPPSSPAPPSPSPATTSSSSAPRRRRRRRRRGGGGGGGGSADPSGPLVSVDNLRAYLQIIDDASILGLNHDILLQSFAQELGRLDANAQKEIAHYAFAQIQPRVSVIREKLAELYESEQQWSKEAQMLSGIDLESGIRMLDDAYKLSKCVQIALLYLE